MKSILHVYMQYMGPRIPNFHPFRSTIRQFQYITHFRIFPLAPMLNFQVQQKLLIFWQILTFIAHMILCENKCHRVTFFLILADRQHFYNFLFPQDYLTCIYLNVGLDRLKIVGVAF